MKTKNSFLFFFAVMAINFLFFSCKKDVAPDFAASLWHACPYLSDSVYTPTDIAVDTTLGWEKFYSGGYKYRRINPSDSSDIVVFLPDIKDVLDKGTYFFSLTAAKKEAAKTGKKLPTKELTRTIQNGLSNFEYSIHDRNLVFGFYVQAKYFFAYDNTWKNISEFYGAGSDPVLSFWGGNDPRGSEALFAEYTGSSCTYSIGLTPDQKLYINSHRIDYICLQIRWAK